MAVHSPTLRYALLLALLPPTTARAIDLDGDNFDRHVYGRTGPSFVKFYAPWCGHCQKLAPHWEKVEKQHKATSDTLLVGNVDCSSGPEGRNPLCDTHKAMGLPTLLVFNPPMKKGIKYEGNLTSDALLPFAAEIGSACSLANQDECTEDQRDWIATADAKPIAALSSEISAKRMKIEMNQMQ